MLVSLEELMDLEAKDKKVSFCGSISFSNPRGLALSDFFKITWAEERKEGEEGCQKEQGKEDGEEAFAMTVDWRIPYLMNKSSVASMVMDHARIYLEERSENTVEEGKFFSKEEAWALAGCTSMLIKTLTGDADRGFPFSTIYFTRNRLDGKIRASADVHDEVSSRFAFSFLCTALA